MMHLWKLLISHHGSREKQSFEFRPGVQTLNVFLSKTSLRGTSGTLIETVFCLAML